jgi:hypothetical protein
MDFSKSKIKWNGWDESERESSKGVCLNRGLLSQKKANAIDSATQLTSTHFGFSAPHLA